MIEFLEYNFENEIENIEKRMKDYLTFCDNKINIKPTNLFTSKNLVEDYKESLSINLVEEDLDYRNSIPNTIIINIIIKKIPKGNNGWYSKRESGYPYTSWIRRRLRSLLNLLSVTILTTVYLF